ncbi:hypothetical protein DWB84_12785 [Saccharophagus sp. K07]|uniref:hypothetical protein n=1 Tax=Saccharophagus sp. K07 TaxID=2283636 RepID=UPI0016526384|nr:hypothetical protein [Saccharophagus sp. K07]MBC6906332.1 hypothetical protein [Saccharophagus sp. K07]
MEKLTLSDLCILIPLLERELEKIHCEIDSDDDEISNDASELSVPYGATSAKLEKIYKSLWSEGDNYPSYEDLLKRK